MKKNWSAFIYVPVLACVIAGGGAYIWHNNVSQSQDAPQQVYYLDEYFETESKHSSEAHVVDEKDVVLEKSPANIEESALDVVPDGILESMTGTLTDVTVDEQAQFILHLVDNHVLVYRKDNLRECYMSTGIGAEDLPEDTLKEIEEGKEILDEEALYFFLESYSS